MQIHLEDGTTIDFKKPVLWCHSTDKKLTTYTYFVQEIILNFKTYIKNVVTGWADKKPFGDTALLSEHRVKAIFVSTRRTNLKLIFHINIFNFVIHTILPVKIDLMRTIISPESLK